MAKNDHRIKRNNIPLPYTCENYSYQTNDRKGQSHGSFSSTLGSVFDRPLITANGYSLWLEHVIEKGSPEELYWLMWYDSDGIPMPMSAVFRKDDLRNMISMLTDFVP